MTEKSDIIRKYMNYLVQFHRVTTSFQQLCHRIDLTYLAKSVQQSITLYIKYIFNYFGFDRSVEDDGFQPTADTDS